MVRLKEAQLNAFGKFIKKKISLADGLQVFYGDNEAGKSTLQLFIKTMLYGISNQRKSASVVLRDRERMIPWGEKYAEGILKLTADGKQIEIYRRIGKTPAGDKLEVMDALTGEVLSEFSGTEPGDVLFGIPVEVFEKTFWIRQGSSFPVGTDEELSRRLMNLQTTGAEEISYDATKEALEQIRKSLRAKDKRGVPGILDTLYQEKDAKTQERFQLLSQREQRKADKERYEAAKLQLKSAQKTGDELTRLMEKQQQLQKMQAQHAKLREAKRLEQLIKQIEESERNQIFQSLTDAMLQEAENAKRRIETLDQMSEIGYDKGELEKKIRKRARQTKTGKLLLGIGAMLLLLSLILGVARIPLWYLYLGCGSFFALATGLSGAWIFKTTKTALFELYQEQSRIQEEETNRQEDLKVQSELLSDILEQFSCKTVEELRQGSEDARKAKLEAESYKNAYHLLLNDDDLNMQLEELTEDDKALLQRNLAEELQRNQEQKMEILRVMKDFEGKLSYVYQGGRNPADVEAELSQIDEQIVKAQTRLKAIELAQQVFQKVYEERKTEFAPQVNAKVNEFLDILLSGKYQDVRVSDSYRMRIGADNGKSVEAEYVSSGTYEQIYFALRLALGELIGNGKEPLFLDDFLVNYDDLRAKKAVTLLKELSQTRQIFLFTCHQRVCEFAQEVSAVINDLEEEIEDVC